jgi:hypothetical protein
VVAAEELAAAGDAAGVQCSRVEVVANGAEVEDPAGSGGDDAAWKATVSDIFFTI